MSSVGQPEHLSLLLDAAPVAIVAVDEAGRIVHSNAQVERLFGYDRADLLGMPVEDLVPERFRGAHPALRASYDAAPAARSMGAGRDLYALRCDGTEMPVEIGLSPISTSQGHFVLATIIDITERKRAEELRLQTVGERRRRIDAEADRDRALDASQLKSQFVAAMSHELRTPLNAIIGISELLSGNELTDRQRNYVEKINESAEALLGIISNILDFSKIEAGKVHLDVRRFELESIVCGAVDVLAQTARQKGLRLHCFIDPAVPPVLEGDADRLRQILLNLIGNAVKFTTAGRVVVRALAEGSIGSSVTVRFEIDDTGIGIASDVLPKLFEPFVQADDSASRRFGGTGLGLSISRRLVELMGGTIAVTSEVAVGSRFSFTVRFDVAPGSSPVPHIFGISALVATEDEMLAEILESYLSSWAIPSVKVRSVEDALKILDAGRIAASYIAIVEVPGNGSAALSDAFAGPCGLEPGRVITIGPDEALRRPVRASRFFDRIVETVSRVDGAGQERNEGAQRQTAWENPPTVLVAEDSTAMHEVLINQFEQLGVGVTIVGDGAQAVAAVERGTFDLVFMDCQMPSVDGFEATRLIRNAEKGSARHIPIVAMTANAFKEDRDACLVAGMDDYLSKPVRLKSINEMLHKWYSPSGK